MGQGPGEEPAGRGGVPLLGQQHVDDLPVLVDRPVQVPPPAGDLDVSLIDEPPVPRGVPEPQPPSPGLDERNGPHRGRSPSSDGQQRTSCCRWWPAGNSTTAATAAARMSPIAAFKVVPRPNAPASAPAVAAPTTVA